MDELTFLLILSGIGVVLLVAMFTYYKHHKKIHDEIQDFNHHVYPIEDVLLSESKKEQNPLLDNEAMKKDDLPDSFSASRQDAFNIDEIHLDTNSQHGNTQVNDEQVTEDKVSEDKVDDRELVDGVYINSKRVISNSPAEKKPTSSFKIQTDTYNNFVESTKQNNKVTEPAQALASTKVNQDIKISDTPTPKGIKDLIISHTILAKGEYFRGPELFATLQSAGLSFGEMNIFHYPGDNKAKTFALFSVANIVEPGTFNPEDAENLSTPGISLFMRLPTQISSNKAYEKFIQVAKFISTKLNGELCDETRSQLTQQAIGYKKEQIRKLNFEMAKAEKMHK